MNGRAYVPRRGDAGEPHRRVVDLHRGPAAVDYLALRMETLASATAAAEQAVVAVGLTVAAGLEMVAVDATMTVV